MKKHVVLLTIIGILLLMRPLTTSFADEWGDFTWSFQKDILYINTITEKAVSIPNDGPWKKYYSKAKTLELGENIRSFYDMGEMNAVTKLIIHSESAGGDMAFQNNKKLQEVVYTGENPCIYGTMFHSTRLKKITIENPDADFIMEENILYSRDHTTLYYYFDAGNGNVVIPEGVRIINGSAFANSKIKSIQLPSSLEMIGEYAFQTCKNLKELRIPASVKHIGSGAFGGCSALTSIVFDGESFDNNMFFDGSKLVSPDNMGYADDPWAWVYDSDGNTIGSRWIRDGSWGLFAGTGIQEIELPICHGLQETMFYSCKNLKKVSLAEGTEILSRAQNDMVFYQCKKLESIYIPDSVVFYDDSYRVFANIPSKCCILCHSGSNAEAYAIKYNIKYQIIP